MQIQKISNQNFGVTILSDKIQNTLNQEREIIRRCWGDFSPVYDYLYQKCRNLHGLSSAVLQVEVDRERD